jgi:hypothetical protein
MCACWVFLEGLLGVSRGQKGLMKRVETQQKQSTAVMCVKDLCDRLRS